LVAPYHLQISTLLRQEIQSGRYKQGDPFTTEKQLETRFGVSSTTARRAIQTLVQEGYLYRRVGKGTFVRRPQFEEPLGALCSFFQESEAIGLTPSATITGFERRPADATIADKLGIFPEDSVYWLGRILKIGDDPVALSDSYFTAEIGDLISRDVFEHNPIFEAVESHTGARAHESETLIEAGAAKAKEADILRVPEGFPVLIMERTVYAINGKTLWTTRYIHRSDKYRFKTRNIRNSSKRVLADERE
jgi:GntR family transcriptional regulator